MKFGGSIQKRKLNLRWRRPRKSQPESTFDDEFHSCVSLSMPYRLKDELRGLRGNRAWASNHYSDEPLHAIIGKVEAFTNLQSFDNQCVAVPTVTELRSAIKLSMDRFLKVDVKRVRYEFVDGKV